MCQYVTQDCTLQRTLTGSSASQSSPPETAFTNQLTSEPVCNNLRDGGGGGGWGGSGAESRPASRPAERQCTSSCSFTGGRTRVCRHPYVVKDEGAALHHRPICQRPGSASLITQSNGSVSVFPPARRWPDRCVCLHYLSIFPVIHALMKRPLEVQLIAAKMRFALFVF